MKKNRVYKLDKYDQQIVELVANQRQQNKVDTGWDGFRTVNKESSFELNRDGFGAEFIFCKTLNLYPDFSIHNTSKVLGTDYYDAYWCGMTVDVKVNRNPDHPLMIPEYAKSECKLFALFSCLYPRYRFEGFATNRMIFKKSNLKMTRVMSYVLEKKLLLDLEQLDI
jgi:hypothetical protein